VRLFIKKVEIGAEYQDTIYNFWISAKMDDNKLVNVFDYNCFDFRNKCLTSVECLLYANLDIEGESDETIAGTYLGQVGITNWRYIANDMCREEKYHALKTTNGIILFNEKELDKELTGEVSFLLHVARYDLVGYENN